MTDDLTSEQAVALREERGLTKTGLAELIGKRYRTVHVWECGRKRPPKWLRLWFLGYDYEQTAAGMFRVKRKG